MNGSVETISEAELRKKWRQFLKTTSEEELRKKILQFNEILRKRGISIYERRNEGKQS